MGINEEEDYDLRLAHSTYDAKQSLYAHLVSHRALGRLVALDLPVDDNVEISVISGVGRAGQRALDRLVLGDSDGLWCVEDGLLPVGVLPLARSPSTTTIDGPWREGRC